MMIPFRQSFRVQARALLWIGIFFLLALPISILDRGRILTPELLQLQKVFFWGMGLTLPYWIYLFIKKIRPLFASKSSLARWTYFGLSTLAHMTVIVGALAVLTLAINFELFEPRYLNQAKRSPDRKKTAYLYREGLFCGFKILVRERWQWELTERFKVFRKCASGDAPTIVWSKDSETVWLVTPNGRKMEDNSEPFNIFPAWH